MLSLAHYLFRKWFSDTSSSGIAIDYDESDNESEVESVVKDAKTTPSAPASESGVQVKSEKSVAQIIASQLIEIDEIRNEGVQVDPESQLNLVEEEEETNTCIYAYGNISHKATHYVVIDNRYMCETKFIEPPDLQPGDKVYYVGYKATKGEEFKVRKIIRKIPRWEEETDENRDNETSNDWYQDDYILQNKERPAITSCPQPELKRSLCQRAHVGKIDSRNGRLLYLEDNTMIDLDKVEAEFVPVIGDFVSLTCLVEVNDEVGNYKGEIMEILKISPLRTRNELGTVTEYNDMQQFGKINNQIIFNKLACHNYLPRVGDKVVVQSIESEQGLQVHWRATNVASLADLSDNSTTASITFESQLKTDEMVNLLKDKKDIEISRDTCIYLNINEERMIEVKIQNKGKVPQKIKHCVFAAKKGTSQLILKEPAANNSKMLLPYSEITYLFKCKPKFFGQSKEIVVFKFDGFKIGRIFEIMVNSINSCDVPQTENVFNFSGQNSQSVLPEPYEDGMYIKGIKPYKSARFIRQRPVTWKIPAILWSTIDMIVQEKKTRTESEFALQEKIACLNQPLSFKNYKQRFNYLLYLEEIALILNMKKFNMDSAVMHKSGEYLTLNVPGLAEKRPSLIIGDRISIRYAWSKDSKQYEGYIHKIRSTDVYLKFNEGFHQSYIGEDCQVNFIASTTVIQRCHTAIGEVVNSLGEGLLFPNRIHQKEPQYNFVDEDEEVENEEEEEQSKLSELKSEEDRMKLIESIFYKRKLKWFNKALNEYQKKAVKNVLKGLARPLPYVVFGPPGTGKTITVVETILQIRFTISESRILIATPSNSSANLITERLLDSEVLQPGDLVRLVAYHYLEGDLIPERLIPYCATADIAEEGTRSNNNRVDSRGFQSQITLRTLCRHRIIVGTCTALGVLWNMGCKSGHFTHILIDEAGQASEPEIMIPLSLAHKNLTQIVLAGDPKQLGPINQSRLAGYFGLNESFLVRLLHQFPYQKDPEGFETGYDPRLVTKLLINYRSLPEILALPNKLFYDDELIPQVDPKDSDEAKLLELLTDELPKRVGGPPAIVFHCTYGTNIQDPDSPSWHNPEEAAKVSIYLGMLYNNGLTPDDIGIITPYSKQVFKIKTQLALLEIEPPKVGSVEEFQGQERKVILLSTVRTSEGKVEDDIKHSLGFVAARERLNVAITRARALLIIIGNPKLLQQDVYWRNVIEYCKSRNSVITDF